MAWLQESADAEIRTSGGSIRANPDGADGLDDELGVDIGDPPGRLHSAFQPGSTVWVVGVTPGGTVRRGTRHLFYLMKVGIRAASHAEMWRQLPDNVRQAKSARRHLLGDLFEPIDDTVDGRSQWQIDSYHPPRPGHSHDYGSPPAWHRDIDASYNGRRPLLLAGDPEFTWVWNWPLVRLLEGTGRLPRNPVTSPTLSDFADRLADGVRRP